MTTTEPAGGALVARPAPSPFLRRSVVPSPAAVRALRREIAAGLLADVTPRQRTDVLLVVSELLSNAVAASPRGVPVVVSVVREPRSIVVEVENRGRLDTASLDFTFPPAGRLSGRGLAVAHALATELDVHSHLGQTRVQAVVPID